jgi:hypothetical protein
LAAGAYGRRDLRGIFDLLHRQAAVDYPRAVEFLEKPGRVRIAVLEVRTHYLFG